jgi:hypothetical protein
VLARRQPLARPLETPSPPTRSRIGATKLRELRTTTRTRLSHALRARRRFHEGCPPHLLPASRSPLFSGWRERGCLGHEGLRFELPAPSLRGIRGYLRQMRDSCGAASARSSRSPPATRWSWRACGRATARRASSRRPRRRGFLLSAPTSRFPPLRTMLAPPPAHRRGGEWGPCCCAACGRRRHRLPRRRLPRRRQRALLAAHRLRSSLPSRSPDCAAAPARTAIGRGWTRLATARLGRGRAPSPPSWICATVTDSRRSSGMLSS